ncbi:Predicted ATP-dependent endonuclease of the OLD family, contains P-loop ATPase and TOPRIM domains [Mameliella alba]|uniref:ATP-dependent nuclease n=1 Tax=Mameliella alba TaxID=561184 RepID=UPI000892151D|nr:AAA family ATPase [Mameliella alba]OWV48223.1 hypothetical protein CDZ96_10425 [Mameliella alba]PTR40263.1 putative ATP-dependent endonuclease of OLD family [Mameliella alba]GGF43581.1 hypothetical protein GCM10011319_01710 [Mameliella alba]SDC97477.1 Predicted ATP-dependent endonuclease of the OLD family, contains P-loop ATPase and TOPRIM domains [Mameliella alba]
MKINSVSVKGYRTIKEELAFNMDRSITFVGPNNSGKTNTLKAIKYFFTGYENKFSYDFEADICKGEKSLRTSIQLTVGEINPLEDSDIIETVDAIRAALLIMPGPVEEITLYLTFSPNSNPVYRVYPNSKSPKGSEGVAYSRLVRRLFDLVLDRVSIHYIPSEKSVVELYKGLVEPFLFRELYDVILPHLGELDQKLTSIAGEINDILADGGLSAISSSFSLPKNPESFFRDVNFNLRDINETSVFEKGMGIQSATLMSGFCWIAKQERQAGKLSVWLLEEPESFLHPEMVGQCLRLLSKLAEDAQVITTTHSLGFVPQDPSKVIGVQLNAGWTETEKFKTYHEATKKIRSSLGVRFSDYYNLSSFNVFVEGQTDRLYLKTVLKGISKNPSLCDEYPTLMSEDLSVQDFGGTSGLEGFLKATFEFIKGERATITLFDGDDAGDRARKALQGYLGNKNIGFEHNRDFVILRDRFAVEGLLPDSWIKEIYNDHPGWFADYAEDSGGAILPFKVKDANKDSYLKAFEHMVSERETDEWMGRWKPVLDACEKSLSDQHARLM